MRSKNNMDKRITEQPSHYDNLEQMSVEQLTADINNENTVSYTHLTLPTSDLV